MSLCLPVELLFIYLRLNSLLSRFFSFQGKEKFPRPPYPEMTEEDDCSEPPRAEEETGIDPKPS